MRIAPIALWLDMHICGLYQPAHCGYDFTTTNLLNRTAISRLGRQCKKKNETYFLGSLQSILPGICWMSIAEVLTNFTSVPFCSVCICTPGTLPQCFICLQWTWCTSTLDLQMIQTHRRMKILLLVATLWTDGYIAAIFDTTMVTYPVWCHLFGTSKLWTRWSASSSRWTRYSTCRYFNRYS